MISSTERPVPLHYSYVTTTLHETIEERLETHQAPIYVVHFSRAAAIEQAQALTSLKVCTREEKDAIADLIGDFRFTAGFGKTLSRLVRNGHRRAPRRDAAEVPPAGRAAGPGRPAQDHLRHGHPRRRHQRADPDGAADLAQQVRRGQAAAAHGAGVPPDRRPGRSRRVRHRGHVVVQAPDHVVANEKALAKAGDDPKKRRKVVRKKPPEGTVGYGQPTYDRLVAAEPEPLESSFAVSHAMLLNVIARAGRLLRRRCGSCSPTTTSRRDAQPQARPPRDRDLPRPAGDRRGRAAARARRRGRRARLTVDLQADFALNQPLSPFALAALDLLDHEADDVRARRRLGDRVDPGGPAAGPDGPASKARGEAVEAMKAEGIEYEERMELLEDVTYPQPLAELLEVAYAATPRATRGSPTTQLAPKSVVREMSEQAMTFTEYVSTYQLARSEGIVLRYLADAYKALRQTVPEASGPRSWTT